MIRETAGRDRARVRGIAALALLIALGGSLAATAGCADPGRAALERVERGAEALIRIAERRATGELDEVATNAALLAWERTHGVVIAEVSAEASRALGSEARAALAERWREVAERLGKRLGEVTSDKASPR